MRAWILLITLIVYPVFSLAQTPVEDANVPTTDDPFETFNRHAYHLNDTIDHILIKPLSTIYNEVLPHPISKGISNMFGNISDVPAVPNDILQGKIPQAFRDLLRVVVNTTIGLGGFFDFSTQLGLERHRQDVGLTFARWGYEDSRFLVLPFLGPSTIRDAIGLPINYEYFTVYPYIHNVMLRNILWSSNVVVQRAGALKFEKVIQEISIDPYVFQKNAYLQHRRHMINRNKGIISDDSFVPEVSDK